jgi:hypothetical protein
MSYAVWPKKLASMAVAKKRFFCEKNWEAVIPRHVVRHTTSVLPKGHMAAHSDLNEETATNMNFHTAQRRCITSQLRP